MWWWSVVCGLGGSRADGLKWWRAHKHSWRSLCHTVLLCVHSHPLHDSAHHTQMDYGTIGPSSHTLPPTQKKEAENDKKRCGCLFVLKLLCNFCFVSVWCCFVLHCCLCDYFTLVFTGLCSVYATICGDCADFCVFLWSFWGNLSSFLSLCSAFIWFWLDSVSSYGHFVSLWGSFVSFLRSYWASLWSYLSCCGSLWSFLCRYCVFLWSFCVVLVFLWLFVVNNCLFVAILTLQRENVDLLGTCRSLQRCIHDETSWQRHVTAHPLWYLCTWKHVYKELTTWNGPHVQRSSRRGYKHVLII